MPCIKILAIDILLAHYLGCSDGMTHKCFLKN